MDLKEKILKNILLREKIGGNKMSNEQKFMEELKELFEKYHDEMSLNQMINSADLFIDTLKKERER
jgi:hypothetical protein